MRFEDQNFSVQPPKIESGEKVKYGELIDRFRKLSQAGDPAHLDENDPEVQEAEILQGIWQAQKDEESNFSEDVAMRNNFEKTMFYFNAGFHESSYLSDVLDWLYQDAQNVEKMEENPERVQLRKDIAKAIRTVRALLRS